MPPVEDGTWVSYFAVPIFQASVWFRCRLEQMCLGSEASGTVPQRLRELEIITFGEHSESKEPRKKHSKGQEQSGPDEGAEEAGSSGSLGAEHSNQEDPELWALPAAKRPRHHEVQETFQLLGNAGPAASNPVAFKKFPLREEQLRSLAWMYGQEGRSDGLKGGLLADKMGYGKTATTIGLLSEDHSKMEDLPRPRGFIKNSATLIMCPQHLVVQWEDEFVKFLGEEGVEVSRAATPRGRFHCHPDPIKLTSDNCPVSIVGFGRTWIVSDLSALRSPQHRNPKKQVQVGDEIEDLTLFNAYGLPIFRIDRRTAEFSMSELNSCCKRGYTLHLATVRDKPGRSRAEPVKGRGPFRILSIASTIEGKRLRLGCLCDFDVVLASTSLLESQRHVADVRTILQMWQPEDNGYHKAMAGKQQALHKCVEKWHEKDAFLEAAKRTAPILFEAMWWKRVVLDEFHETESWKSAVREVLKSIGATHRWGLSGTPPLSNTDSVLEVAELFHYIRKETSPTMALALKSRQSQKLQTVQAKQKLHEECQAMIHGFVRQNSSALIEAIEVINHQEFVEHTAEERLIYRQACHDQGVFDLEAAGAS